MSIEDDLETDLASLRRELLDWILTEIRSGRDRESLAGGPLAEDLAEVVRGGVQGAVDQSVRRIEDQRAAVLVEALGPTFARLSQELAQRGEGADARLVSLETSIADLRQALAAAPRGGARNGDRTDEILREIRSLGGGGGEATPARSIQPPRLGSSAEALAMSRSRQAIGAGVGLALLVLAGGAGWVLHSPASAPPLAPQADIADQAHQLQTQLSDLSNATPASGAAAAPKVDPQAIAGDAADVAAAIEHADNATTPDDLRKAHQEANDAIAQIKGVLDFDNPGKRPTANATDTAPPAARTPRHAPPPSARTTRRSPHGAATPSPALAAPTSPPADTPPGAGGGH